MSSACPKPGENTPIDPKKEEYEKTLKTYSDLVYRIAFSHLGNRYNADDIYQEVFLTYIRKNPAFECEEHKKAWFIRVTTNLCKNLWKSSWYRHITLLDETPEPYQIVDEQYEDLYQVISELPPKYKSVIYLYYFEGYSMKDIADILQIKESSVSSRVTRARKILKKKLM